MISVKPVPAKALKPIDFTDGGIVISVNPVLANADCPIDCNVDGRVISVRPVLPKALPPIDCNDDGKLMLVKDLHPQNALSPMVVNLNGNVTFSKDVQFINAADGISVKS